MYGPFLRQLREHRSMTQADLAESSGVSQPNISAIENGHRSPTIETFGLLVECCGFELAAVAGDEIQLAPRDPTVAVPPAPREMTEDQRRRELMAVLDVSESIMRSK